MAGQEQRSGAMPGGGVRPRVAVLVPAAGAGTRMGDGAAPAKQFRSLGGAPVLVQTLRAFAHHPAIDAVVVAAPPARVDDVAAELLAHGLADARASVAVVAGGASRQASVARALAAIPPGTHLVLIHDAVRPLVTAAAIADVVAATHTHGAAALAVPVADTLRRGDGERFGATVDRTALYAMQTPQGARLDLLRMAFSIAESDDFEATDEVALLQHAGVAVRLVEGDAANLKLTRPSDWALAEALWAQTRGGGREGREPARAEPGGGSA